MDKISPLVATLHKRFESLQTQRSNIEQRWQEVADYFLPRKADIVRKRAAGERKDQKIFDSTAQHAVELLAANLHGTLTSPSVPWFAMRFRDKALQNEDAANEWLEICTQQMYQALERSNFQQEIHELYYDLVVFGTAALAIEKEIGQDLRFSTRHIAEIYIAENHEGRVDTVFRKYELTARQAEQKFGKNNLSNRIKKSLENTPLDKHSIINVIYPRGDTGKTTAKDKPFASIHYCYDSKYLMQESGYDSMVLATPRFTKDSSSVYGHSPAHTCLADAMMVSKMAEIGIRAAQKQLDPPLMVPDDGYVLPVRTTPGALNFYRSGSRDRIEPLKTDANNLLQLNQEERRQEQIRRIFYVDQLLASTDKTMTATQTLQMQEERLRMLGPVLGRLQSELLQPLISRTFELLLSQGVLPPAPDELQGQDIDIEYVSPLAKAQKIGDLQNLVRGVEIMTSLAEVIPGITDYIDNDGLVQYLVEITGMPARVIRSDQEVAAMRKEQQEAAAAQQSQEQDMQNSEQARNVAPLLQALQANQGAAE
tara:strand:+ start:506 stop:2122 length:1617 start_codon:yes stop_codon:yes gene_type:complete